MLDATCLMIVPKAGAGAGPCIDVGGQGGTRVTILVALASDKRHARRRTDRMLC